jgi:hypothetical protein
LAGETIMKLRAISAFAALLLAAPLVHAGHSAAYMLTFVPTWSPASHPLEYPVAQPRAGHFAPLIGATHGNDYRIFELGVSPTPGLERLSERGKHDPLDAEINAAIKAGTAGTLIETADAIRGPVHQPVSATFVIDDDHPMVSIVTMIAPSPDWFTGVSVNLQGADGWVPNMTAIAYAYDSGGDHGTTYLADNADADPKGLVSLAANPHFKRDGQPVPVGVFVFTRLQSSHE